jgi:hypothetical protein
MIYEWLDKHFPMKHYSWQYLVKWDIQRILNAFK